mgnify:CR=1 FL=1
MINLKLIVCCDINYGIGKNGKLPWNIQSEMKLFKEKTIFKLNNCVIMGRSTYESIPEKYKPLKDRKNCILSSTLNKNIYRSKNIEVFKDLSSCIEWIQKTKYDEYWIIGGKMIYESFMDSYEEFIEEIHVSIINKNFDCDCFFNPKLLNNNNFTKIFNKIYESKDNNEIITFNHMIFKRKKDCL